MGFEPTTSSLGSWHSTTELLPLSALQPLHHTSPFPFSQELDEPFLNRQRMVSSNLGVPNPTHRFRLQRHQFAVQRLRSRQPRHYTHPKSIRHQRENTRQMVALKKSAETEPLHYCKPSTSRPANSAPPAATTSAPPIAAAMPKRSPPPTHDSSAPPPSAAPEKLTAHNLRLLKRQS